MGYLTLKIKNLSGGLIYETDFLTDVFEQIVRNVLFELVNKKKISAVDPYQAWIIPRYDDSPDYDGETFITSEETKEDIKYGEKVPVSQLGIQFDDSSVTDTPVKYFTLKLRVQNRDFIYYRKDFHPIQLKNFIDFVIGMLIHKGKLVTTDDFSSEIIARHGDTPRIDLNLYKRVVSIPSTLAQANIKSYSTGLGGTGKYDDVEGISDLITLESEEQQAATEIKVKEISTYHIREEIGKVSDDDLKIFIRKEAINRLNKETRPSVKLGKELIGVLVGDVYRDPGTKEMFVEILDIIPAEKARSGFTYAVLDNKTLNEINDLLNDKYPGKCNVGWYHTHLIKMIRLSQDKGDYNFKEAAATFFSSDDYFVHQHFFKQPWHVAIVVDPDVRQMLIFQWKKGQIVTCGGYYICR
jgi:hypothetical protein